MTRNLSVWNSLRPFSVGFDSIFEEFDRMLESTERHNSNYPPYNIHRINENNYKIEVAFQERRIPIKDIVESAYQELNKNYLLKYRKQNYRKKYLTIISWLREHFIRIL